jgi:hypothetical protein
VESTTANIQHQHTELARDEGIKGPLELPEGAVRMHERSPI